MVSTHFLPKEPVPPVIKMDLSLNMIAEPGDGLSCSDLTVNLAERNSPIVVKPYIYLYMNHNRLNMSDKSCSSCGKRLVGAGITFFKCPTCAGEEIGRCSNCRDQSVMYECKKCGFRGP